MSTLLHAPIYLFQMGKVGSSSLRATLAERWPGPVFHGHGFEKLCDNGKRVASWRLRLRLPILVISPVREPIARNVSAFFQNFHRDTGFQFADRTWTSAELKELFLKHCRHNVPLEWFDRHLRTAFGVDVFARPFDVDRRWSTYRHRSVRVLVYRADLDRDEQLRVVSRFVGRTIDRWSYDNVAEDKDYAALYADFCATVRLPTSYVRVMCESRYCRQFWSAEEIAQTSARWSE